MKLRFDITEASVVEIVGPGPTEERLLTLILAPRAEPIVTVHRRAAQIVPAECRRQLKAVPVRHGQPRFPEDAIEADEIVAAPVEKAGE